MNILILSYFFTPDFSAGSFRTQALIDSLSSKDSVSNIYIFTSMPNRYSYAKKVYAKKFEEIDVKGKKIKIFRSQSIQHRNSFILQIISFIVFVFSCIRWSFAIKNSINIIHATSSRFGTALLGFLLSSLLKVKINLDIRDIFSDSLIVLSKRNLFLKIFTNIISKVEKYVFKNSHSITYVSKGFHNDLNINSKKNTLYIPNGIDKLFIEFSNSNFVKNSNPVEPFKITYAGNIGYAQGLHNTIPKLAKYFDSQLQFDLIGSGNAIALIKQSINKMELNNIKIIEPVNRKQLINFYKNSDILFLQLNSDKAFQKVLPSKIFEYSVFNIPILAGVAGNARDFILKELENSYIFTPNNLDEAKFKIEQILGNYYYINRKSFIKKFNRERLMDNLSDFLIKNAGNE